MTEKIDYNAESRAKKRGPTAHLHPTCGQG